MQLINKAIFDGIVWGVGGKVILIIVNFVVLMVTSRALSAQEFGVYAAALIFVEFGYGLANSTVGTPIVQKRELSDDEKRGGFTIFLLLGLAVGGGLILWAHHIEALMNIAGLDWLLRVIGLLMPLRLLSGYYGSILLRDLHMRYFQLTQSLPQILSGLLTIVVALLGYGVWSLVVGFALATVLEFGMTCLRSRVPAGFPRSLDAFRGLLKVGMGTAIARLLNLVATNIDRALVGRCFGAEGLGLYARAFSLMLVPFKLFGLVIGRVFLSVFSKVDGDADDYRALLTRVLCVQAIVYIPLSVGFVLSSSLLVNVVLGAKWHASIIICQILFSALFARLGYEIVSNAFLASGKVWLLAFRQGYYIVLVAVCVIGGYALWGLNGIAAGISLAMIAFYALSIFQACQEYRCPSLEIAKAHAAGFLIAGGALLAGALVSWQFDSNFSGIDRYNFAAASTYWVVALVLFFATSDPIVGQSFSTSRRHLLGVLSRKFSKIMSRSSIGP